MIGALLVVALGAPQKIDPAHAKNITVFHVNPHKAGAIPVNMDTGNPAGDLFFDLFEVMMTPLACQHHAGAWHKHGHLE